MSNEPIPCPNCGSLVFRARMFGREYLNEGSQYGQMHVCAHKLPEIHAAQAAAVATGKALESSRSYSDTTGNRVPRWHWHGGATGDVDPY